ncbi:MAG: hypothetical protein A2051_13790 [Desulfovibrionales bacterium GWA2_65_9]|nr:MAG: hypothetical protein A2051_13790 [Desulfovibrionales bacterium GWA2_65_9]
MPGGDRVCPAGRAGWLSTSLRRMLGQNPETILRGLIGPGETVVDIGCGPGFFTLPLARMVGEKGCVVAVDLQEAMLEKMRLRAAAAGLLPRIRPQLCTPMSLGFGGPADFALAFYMVHEVPDVVRFMDEIHGLLKERGRLLLVEPKFHVRAAKFWKTVEITWKAGFTLLSEPRITLSRAVLFERV